MRKGSVNAQNRKAKRGGAPEVKITLAVLLVLIIAWVPVSYFYAASRSANVLDEVYYATLDKEAGYARFRGHVSPTVLTSFFCPFKTGGILVSTRGCFLDDPTYDKYSLFGRGKKTEYVKAGSDRAVYGHEWERWDPWTLEGPEIRYHIEDGEVGEGRRILLSVYFDAQTPSGDASVSVNLVYDADSKTLSETYPGESTNVSIQNLDIVSEPLDHDPSSALSLAVGYTYDEAVEEALSVLEDFLRSFVAARDNVDWWFANPVGELHGAGDDVLEGVTIDLDLEG